MLTQGGDVTGAALDKDIHIDIEVCLEHTLDRLGDTEDGLIDVGKASRKTGSGRTLEDFSQPLTWISAATPGTTWSAPS